MVFRVSTFSETRRAGSAHCGLDGSVIGKVDTLRPSWSGSGSGAISATYIPNYRACVSNDSAYLGPVMLGAETIDFPDFEFGGLIFDLDGTLVDSMPAHFNSWRLALAQFGSPGILGEDVFYAMGGRPTHDIVADLNGEHGLKLDPDAVRFAKREYYLGDLESVALNEQVANFLKAQAGKAPIAVATGASRIGAERTLQAVGLSDLIDEVVTSDDVIRRKPAPDIYLEAASRIGVEPERCVAFEDASAGILSAQSAGMHVVTVPAPVRVVG